MPTASDALASGKMLAPAKSAEEMNRIIFNNYLDAGLSALFAAIVVAVVIFGILEVIKALGSPKDTTHEVGGALAAGE